MIPIPGSGQSAGRQGCYSEGPRWAEEMGQQKPHEVQEKQMCSPASGMEQPCAPVQAGNNWLESSFAQKDLSVLVDNKFKLFCRVPSQQKATAGRGRTPFPSVQHLSDCIWSGVQLGAPSTRQILTHSSVSSRGHQDSQGTKHMACEVEGTGFAQP